MNPNKALWEKGDFTRIAQSMRESGEALVKELGITHGLDVLDLGCGDGTTALPAAMLGANVLGVDIAANLVEAGNERALELGLTNCRFEEGDASDLEGIENEGFDLVMSIFGAMFAPKPFDVAKEAVRVTRPGGRIVMGNWIPGDPTLGGADLENQFCIFPTASRRFRQSDDLGSRRERHRALHCSGSVQRHRSPSTVLFTRSIIRERHRSSSHSSGRTTGPTMNAFEAAAGKTREGNGTASRAGGSVQRAECEPHKRRHLYPRHVLVRDGATVTATLSKGRSPRSRSRYDSVLSRTT